MPGGRIYLVELKVAPHAGAWIETISMYYTHLQVNRSHPMRVRGLKPTSSKTIQERAVSHPMRVRGLKLYLGKASQGVLESHPMRVRGLKLDVVS